MKHFVGYMNGSKADLLSTVIDKPTWFVCPSDSMAAQMFEDLKFFLFFKDKKINIDYFPFRHSDLYPHQIREDHVVSQRVSALHACVTNQGHLVTSIQALSQITIDSNLLKQKTFPLMVETEFEQDILLSQIFNAGYERENQCREPGQFSLRGDILDIYPPNQSQPIRIEFFGDELQTIRFFDPQSQRTLAHEQHKRIEYIEIIPCREIFYPDETKLVVQKVKQHADELELPPTERREIQNAISEKKDFAAISKFFPFFYEQHATLLDYAENETNIAIIDPFVCKQAIKQLQQKLFDATNEQREKKILSADPLSFFVHPESVEASFFSRATLAVSDVHVQERDLQDIEETSDVNSLENLRLSLSQNKKSKSPLEPLFQNISKWLKEDIRVRITFHSQKGAENFQKILRSHFEQCPIEKHPSSQKLALVIGDLHQGFVHKKNKEAWISDTDIFGSKKHFAQDRSSPKTPKINLKQLQLNDPIVHIDFGIGIYKGLTKMAVGGTNQDFVTIEYANQDKLFLPIYRLNRIHPFIGGEGGKPKVDSLGSNQWKQNTAKAKKAVLEMANELISLYAKRKVAKGFEYGAPDEMYFQFESLFPFEETRDQQTTLDEIEKDLRSDKPMDRLVCGDVGFGKTEIALRTAFRVASEGKQVAVLVPTTILCQQHFETFKKRFDPFPIKVDYVSRFKTPFENKTTLEKLKKGTVDIIIGTHRLLSKDVSFANVGLLVLDEEHRFGVTHKERIKTFRNKIDVLTLTATPIPRTLQLSMTGIRDLSLINTPPLDRKAVHTILSSFDENTIKDAVYREIQRGGQVYFLHNRVESITSMQMYLQKLMPDIRIRVGHGQMDKKELEKTMVGFLSQEFDLLLCTTIIESGIDVPNANTLIINRADTFGLAQLYQLRGRVGRSNKDAFAYLLIPGEDLITPLALKRLKTIKKFTELGAGLKIAMHDLEIRGAGNLLGAKQSGHISNVGFELYIQLLEREVRKLKGEKVVEEIEPELQLSLPASIPETYIPDHQERLLFYRKLSSCPTVEELHHLREEMVDRFGKTPPLLDNLFDIIDLKILCRQSGVKSLSISNQDPKIEFSDQADIDMDKLIHMIQKNKNFQLTPDQKLLIHFEPEIEPYGETKKILKSLAVHDKKAL